MEYSVKTTKNQDFFRVTKYSLISLFMVFTVILFLWTGKVQASCHPLVGKSPCVQESNSVLKKGWSKTKTKTAKLFKKIPIPIHHFN